MKKLPKKPKPGILDRIQTCDSLKAAQSLLSGFISTAKHASSKTVNKARRLVATLDFPKP